MGMPAAEIPMDASGLIQEHISIDSLNAGGSEIPMDVSGLIQKRITVDSLSVDSSTGKGGKTAADSVKDTTEERLREVEAQRKAAEEAKLKEPVYSLWNEACPMFKLQGRKYGPFSRPLPQGLSEALPSVDELAKHWSGPEPDAKFYDRLKAYCSQSDIDLVRAMPGSKKVVQAPSDTPICFWVGQKRNASTAVEEMYLKPLENFLKDFGYDETTVLVSAGDHYGGSLPLLVKARPVGVHPGHLTVVPMNSVRHFGKHALYSGTRLVSFEEQTFPRTQLSVCQPFREKKDRLLWRGATTGFLWERKDNSTQMAARWWLLQNWGNNQSSRIDVAPSRYVQGAKGVWKAKGLVKVTEFSENKFLILPEGNDVASASAWSLFASSVVLMPAPQAETVVGHGLLKPWVHFIPLERDFSDLDAKMQWCLDHLNDCEDIAHRASIYMYHLWPGSELFMRAMRRVLKTHFRRYASIIDSCCNATAS